jgi:D-alanyl-D-alanine carboxypeptidase
MANSNEDRGFNSLRDSRVAQRAKNKRLQTCTIFGVLALFVLMLAVLIVMAVGGIAANVGNSGNKTPTGTPDDERVNWGSITVTNTDVHKGDLLIVNNDHVYHFPATDDHLAEIYAQLVSHSPRTYQQGLSKYMDKDALLALDTFLTDFCTETGKNNVLIRYAYRSEEDQKAFETQPGYSDHHTGLGCQLKYTVEGRNYELSTDPTYNWLYENAHKYGFVVRYPADKTDKTGIADYSDYFRYVGVAHATYMHANNLCLEEYVELLKGYTHKKPLGISAADGKYYEVYCVEVNGSATVKVPTNYNYTQSGNNVGGIIITVDRSATAEVETTASTEAPAN